MTVFVGKDLTFKVDGVTVAEVEEFSADVNNGKKDVRFLGSEQIEYFVYTLIEISGSFKITFLDKTFLDDVLAFGTTKTLEVLFGSSYTLTLSEVVYESISLDFNPEEPITAEISFKAESISIV